MVAAEYEFLRLKNIELGYSLPKNLWRNTTVISGIRLFVERNKSFNILKI